MFRHSQNSRNGSSHDKKWSKKSVIREAGEIYLAMDLIRLGARLQFLEAETSLRLDRLIRLYKEIKGVSPPKGPILIGDVVVLASAFGGYAPMGGHFGTLSSRLNG